MNEIKSNIDVPAASADDRKFDAAFNSILNLDRTDYPNWMGGIKHASGQDYKVGSPIDESIVIGTFQLPEPKMADRAMEFAQKAFASWSSCSVAERAAVMTAVRDDVSKNRFRLAAAITISVGMTRKESLGEVDRLLDIMDGCLEEARSLKKDQNASGVWGVIGSHLSPLAAPIGAAFAAILAGCTVVLMPSHLCPLPIYITYDIMSRRGVPDGALNVLTDPSNKTQVSLLDNPGLAGAYVNGSGEGSEELMFSQVDDSLRFIAEIKGMNPAIVSQRSDLAHTAEAVLASAFAYSGQRTDCCSKVIVLDQHYEAFLNQLLKAASSFQVGDPAENGIFMGPVIDKASMESFLELAEAFQSHLVYGGDRIKKGFLADGFFVRPAIFAGLPADHELNSMDHGLPILSVQRAEDLEDAIEKANDCEFGSSSGIFTKDEKEIEAFLAKTNADCVYVNGPSTELGQGERISLGSFLV